MRLTHPGMRPAGAPIRFRFDGIELEALAGETVAAALAASDIVAVRDWTERCRVGGSDLLGGVTRG